MKYAIHTSILKKAICTLNAYETHINSILKAYDKKSISNAYYLHTISILLAHQLHVHFTSDNNAVASHPPAIAVVSRRSTLNCCVLLLYKDAMTS